jgi:hypothetical protein
MVIQSDERSQAKTAASSGVEPPSSHSSPRASDCELLIEQHQSEPPSSERKRLVEILFIKKRIDTVTYRNDA